MKYESTLLTFDEFCEYMRIGQTLGKRLIAQPGCQYVVRVGSRVFIHKELLEQELKKSAKYQSNMIKKE